MTKSNFEKKGYLSAYNFQHTTKSLRGVIAVTQGRNLETGIEVVASCLLPHGCQPVLYIPQDHLFRGSITLIGLGLLHQSLIKKMSPRLVCSPVFGKCLSLYLLRPSFCTPSYSGACPDWLWTYRALLLPPPSANPTTMQWASTVGHFLN